MSRSCILYILWPKIWWNMCLLIKPSPRWIRMKIYGLWSIWYGNWLLKRRICCCCVRSISLLIPLLRLMLWRQFWWMDFLWPLLTFASPIFSYLARSSSKLSFGLLLLCLSRPLPPLALWASSFSPSWQTCSKGGSLADSPCSTGSIGFCFSWRDFTCP